MLLFAATRYKITLSQHHTLNEIIAYIDDFNPYKVTRLQNSVIHLCLKICVLYSSDPFHFGTIFSTPPPLARQLTTCLLNHGGLYTDYCEGKLIIRHVTLFVRPIARQCNSLC